MIQICRKDKERVLDAIRSEHIDATDLSFPNLIDSKAIYKEEKIKIPTPEFIVLYNGTKEYEKETVLNLSAAFMEKNVPFALDLRVKVVNINYDKSSEVLEKSKTLKDYSYFIHQVKSYKNQKLSLEEAVEQAMKDCISQGMLKEFLEENGSEVINMLYTEFNLEDAKEVWQEEAEKRGNMSVRKKGRRIIVHENKKYVWYVKLDYDSPYYILNIISEDKRLIIACPLNMKTPYIISKGQLFQNYKSNGHWNRYHLPFDIPEIITPRFVSELISWATKGSDTIIIEWDGKDILV